MAAAQLVTMALVATASFYAGSCSCMHSSYSSSTQQEPAQAQPTMAVTDPIDVGSSLTGSFSGAGRSIVAAPKQPHTLVIYVYSDTDPGKPWRDQKLDNKSRPGAVDAHMNRN